MLSKEEIDKAKEVTQNYINDTPVLPYDCLMNEERKSAETLLKYINQLEQEKQKVIDIMKADRMEQLDDYVIYLIEKYLKELGALEDE